MGRSVIAVYKPKPGQAAALDAVVAKHWSVLRAEGLITERPAHVMRAKDGTIVEVFEWQSAQAIEAAHKNAQVHKLWAEFGEACDFLPIGNLPEAQQLFSEFEGVST